MRLFAHVDDLIWTIKTLFVKASLCSFLTWVDGCWVDGWMMGVSLIHIKAAILQSAPTAGLTGCLHGFGG